MNYTKYLYLLFFVFALGLWSCGEEEFAEKEIIEEEIVPNLKENNPLINRLRSSSTSGSSNGLDLECFTIDYPFYINVDGTEYEINSEADLEAASQNIMQYADFVYPLNITYTDGETESIADGLELVEAFSACVPDSGWGIDTFDTGDYTFPAYLINSDNSCYEQGYPINLTDIDGNSFSANNEAEFMTLLVDNPFLFFEFPIDLIDEDGAVVSAGDAEELFEILFDCEDWDGPWGGDTISIGGDELFFLCYDFVYPFSVLDGNGETIVINNHDDICNLMLDGGFTGFVFPMDLVDPEGEVTTVNSQEELDALLEECFGEGPGGADTFDVSTLYFNSTQTGLDCYELVFPFTATGLTNGEQITLNNLAEVEALINVMDDLYGVDLPVDVKLISSGEIVTINTTDEYFDLIFTCK